MLVLSSARVIGLLLLAVPAVMALAVSQFPSYDARSRYFAASCHNIVEASRGYVVALGLFLLVAAILVAIAFGLWRSPLRAATGFLMVVVGGLGAAAVGFALVIWERCRCNLRPARAHRGGRAAPLPYHEG